MKLMMINDVCSEVLPKAQTVDAAFALDILKEHSFDAVLAPLEMSALTAETFLSSLRERGDHTPVIFVTDKKDLARVEAMKICCGGHLIAPVEKAQLEQKLAKVSQRDHHIHCL